ncbi:hypothetical protein [Methylocystis parvus]|uniref:hypothetical protein n=1 Tax=Methylocystis parvus TaxID=134 RepID=UPI001FCBF85D|nr:hypothetical protein [Methylocystis parvus]WBJ98663.1 hypothetical protein MMG94_11590 [Methylocystis parvus OBBP]
MSDLWRYQIRFRLPEELAEAARNDPDSPHYRPIAEILRRRGAWATSTFDAFANYVSTAEREGVDRFPLYSWTKATIEDP